MISKTVYLKLLNTGQHLTCFKRCVSKVDSSKVLIEHLRKRDYPYWTSYFVKYNDVVDDLRGKSHFNWKVDHENYHILRTGCWPLIKFHCTKRPPEDLAGDDLLFTALKIINLGIPCLAYGVSSWFLISAIEVVTVDNIVIKLYFLYQEDHNAKN